MATLVLLGGKSSSAVCLVTKRETLCHTDQMGVRYDFDGYEVRELAGLRVASSSIGREDGDVFIILPGLGAGIELVMPIARASEASGAVHVVDVPGFGDSQSMRLHGSYLDVVRRLHSAIGRLRLSRPPILIGQSGGALLAALLHVEYPGDYRGLILFGGTQYRSILTWADPRKSLIVRPGMSMFMWLVAVMAVPRPPDKLRRLVLRSPRARSLLTWPYLARPRHVEVSELSNALVNSGSRHTLSLVWSLRGADLESLLDRLPAIPAASVRGEQDRFVSRFDEEYWSDHLSLSSYTVANAGHWAHLDNWEEFERALALAINDVVSSL